MVRGRRILVEQSVALCSNFLQPENFFGISLRGRYRAQWQSIWARTEEHT
jgi:hypothetical protein